MSNPNPTIGNSILDKMKKKKSPLVSNKETFVEALPKTIVPTVNAEIEISKITPQEKTKGVENLFNFKNAYFADIKMCDIAVFNGMPEGEKLVKLYRGFLKRNEFVDFQIDFTRIKRLVDELKKDTRFFVPFMAVKINSDYILLNGHHRILALALEYGFENSVPLMILNLDKSEIKMFIEYSRKTRTLD